MSNSMLVVNANAIIIAAVPLLFATLGGIFTERSGVSNIGLEGIMLIGAVTGFIVGVHTGSLAKSLSVVILVGALVGLFYAVLTVSLQANQIVSGLALTIFGEGISSFMGKAYLGYSKPVAVAKIPIPLLSKIPLVGDILFNHDPFVYALYIIVPVAWIFLYKTKPGLVLRAVGENPAAVDDTGRNVFLTRYIYVILCNILAAIGGAYLTLVYVPSWTNGMTAGKGWIAVALVIFSTWNPAIAVVGALLFGGIDVLSIRAQAMGLAIPGYFIRMIPYVFTIIVLIIYTGGFSKKKHISSPKALTIPFDREDR